ncbi:MAG TPA: hypothetical protein VJM11_05825 [Nevskiaceae bacterium]|nr:hypothetical protein [Nevskiaceae bacterium]
MSLFSSLAPRPYRLSSIGLEWETEQSVRAMVPILAGRASNAWQYVDDVAAADVVLYEPGSPLAQAVRRREEQHRREKVFIECGRRLADLPGTLRIPIGPSRLIAALQAATGQIGDRASARETAKTPVHQLDAVLHGAADVVAVFTVDGTLGYLDVARQALLWPHAGAPGEMAALLLDEPAVTRVRSVDPAIASQLRGQASRTTTWDAPLWAFGVSKSGGVLLSRLGRQRRQRLTRWPDFGTIGRRSFDIHCCALLVRRGYSVDELARATGIPVAQVINVFNAAALCGILEPADGPVSTAGVAGEPKRPSLLGGVLQRLRQAFQSGTHGS